MVFGFVVVDFALHCWQSREVGGSLFCFCFKLFIQAGFCGGEIFSGFLYLFIRFTVSQGVFGFVQLFLFLNSACS